MYFLLLFRIVRGVLNPGLMRAIWVHDMPNIERIFTLVMDVYLVREMRYFSIEEDLFAKLVFLMRSRELAIKYTRNFDDTYNPAIVLDYKQERRMLTDGN